MSFSFWALKNLDLVSPFIWKASLLFIVNIRIKTNNPPQGHNLIHETRTPLMHRRRLRHIRVAARARLLTEHRHRVHERLVRVELERLDQEPVLQYLIDLDALARDQLQQRYAILVASGQHLAHNRDQVPDAIRLAILQRLQKILVFVGSGHWWRALQTLHVTDYVRREDYELQQRFVDVLFQNENNLNINFLT